MGPRVLPVVNVASSIPPHKANMATSELMILLNFTRCLNPQIQNNCGQWFTQCTYICYHVFSVEYSLLQICQYVRSQLDFKICWHNMSSAYGIKLIAISIYSVHLCILTGRLWCCVQAISQLTFDKLIGISNELSWITGVMRVETGTKRPPYFRRHFRSIFCTKIAVLFHECQWQYFRVVVVVMMMMVAVVGAGQLMISHHWFWYWLGTEQATMHYLKQWRSTCCTMIPRNIWIPQFDIFSRRK